MKNELISMVELIDQHKGRFKTMSNGDYAPQMAEKLDLYENYATFLNTPLNISMFVPAIKVGDKWEVLENYEENTHRYQTAKDNVIFEGFEVTVNVHGVWWVEDKKHCVKSDYKWTIQDLIKYKPTLKKKGLEVSGLNNK